MSQQIGITLGIPVMSAVFTAHILAIGRQDALSVLSGVTAAVWVNAGLCLLAALLVAVFLRRPMPVTPQSLPAVS